MDNNQEYDTDNDKKQMKTQKLTNISNNRIGWSSMHFSFQQMQDMNKLVLMDSD